MKTLLVILASIIITIGLFGCDKSTNPIQSAGNSDNVIYTSDTTLLYENHNPIGLTTSNQSEKYQDINIGTLDFSESQLLLIKFDYLVINNSGIYGNNLQFMTGNENIAIVNTFDNTNYIYLPYQNTYSVNRNETQITLRQTIQYNCVVYSINNLMIYKIKQ